MPQTKVNSETLIDQQAPNIKEPISQTVDVDNQEKVKINEIKEKIAALKKE